MRIRGFTLRFFLGAIAFVAAVAVKGQTVGIGVDFPAATLDIQTTSSISSIRVERLLVSSALFNPTVVITDESDYGVLEVYQQSPANNETLAYFQHDGTGTGIWSPFPGRQVTGAWGFTPWEWSLSHIFAKR